MPEILSSQIIPNLKTKAPDNMVRYEEVETGSGKANIFPIGFIYMSISPTSPGEYFAGTWERFSGGRVLVGVDESQTWCGQSNQIGGSTFQELRAIIGTTNGDIRQIGYSTAAAVPGKSQATYTVRGEAISETSNYSHSTQVLQSNGEVPSTIQPYVAVYMWRRIA